MTRHTATASVSVTRPRRALSPVLILAGLLFASLWGIALFVAGVDPLNIYPWGAAVRTKDTDYSLAGMPYVLEAAIKDPRNDALLIGGSTSHGFTRAMLNAELPGIRHAFNLSYVAPRAFDTGVVESMVLRDARPKRVLLAVDWDYLADRRLALRQQGESSFPFYLYDDTITNDLRMIGLTTLRTSLAVFRGKPVWLPDWSTRSQEILFAQSHAHFNSKANLTQLAQLIARHRGDVDYPASRTCGDFFMIQDQLVPFARTLSARKIPLDVFFNPPSTAIYYDWLENRKWRELGPTLLEDTVALRYCMVQALNGIPGVRVFAFDNEDWITNRLDNYSDSLHLVSSDVFRYMLRSMVAGRDLLTVGNVDVESQKLRVRVRNFHVPQ